MKKTLALLVLTFVIAAVGTAQEESLSVDVRPSLFVPLRESATYFNIGGGAQLAATYDFSSPLFAGGGIGYDFLPTPVQTSLSLVTAEVNGGLRLDLGTIGAFRVGLGAGAYFALYDDLSAINPLVGADAAFEFRLGNSLRLGVGAGYQYGVGEIVTSPSFSETSLVEGLTAFVSASIVPSSASSGPRAPRIEIQTPQFDNVFPVLYQVYDETPIGSVRVTNGERRPISNVQISFLVNQFMDAPKLSATIDRLEPGESADIPILALFRDSVLGITERTSVASEVIVSYEEGDDVLQASRAETLRILNRNNITWDDDRKAAAFVTANDPTVLRFARNVTAAIRGEGVTAVNERLRISMALFEAMRLHGMEYVIDPDSSYIELSADDAAIDYLQFPQQSLDFRTGDCDDLSILYSALLESVGIRTAFVTIPGHIYMAFALDMDQSEAERTFARPEDLIFIDEEAWFPVETTLVREDFLGAWSVGAKQWRENEPSGTAGFFPIREAWRPFPPTGFASEAVDIAVPQTTVVLPVYEEVLDRFIDREIGPQVAALQERIAASNGNPRLLNRLGTLYARYGRYEDAEDQFRAAIANREYLPSLVNLGNLYYLRDDLSNAFRMFERAFEVREDDPEVLISLARVHFDLEDYVPAAARYRQAEIIDPDLVQDFAYIVNENRDSARASAAQNRRQILWNEE